MSEEENVYYVYHVTYDDDREGDRRRGYVIALNESDVHDTVWRDDYHCGGVTDIEESYVATAEDIERHGVDQLY